MKLYVHYRDTDGHFHTLEADTVEALHHQLPDDFDRRLQVRDEAGWCRGWVGKDSWVAKG